MSNEPVRAGGAQTRSSASHSLEQVASLLGLPTKGRGHGVMTLAYSLPP